jgi:hypothetical protein
MRAAVTLGKRAANRTHRTDLKAARSRGNALLQSRHILYNCASP